MSCFPAWCCRPPSDDWHFYYCCWIPYPCGWLVCRHTDSQLGTFIVQAAKDGAIDRVEALLDQGVAVDSWDGDDHRTSLIWASERGHIAVAALLLDRGAEVNAEDDLGWTSSTDASYGGHLDTLQLLVSTGADIHHRNDAGYSSLLCAALEDHLPVCEYLLSLGADLMAASNDGKTALNSYGVCATPILSPASKALRIAALEVAWDAGPVQVQRRRDERWCRRGPLITVLAENAYRPMQLRDFAIVLAAAQQCGAVPIDYKLPSFLVAALAAHALSTPQQPAVALTTKEQRHAFLLGCVFSNEGIVRLLVELL